MCAARPPHGIAGDQILSAFNVFMKVPANSKTGTFAVASL
jgi:uncharacterized protein YcgI (DUF1989 family)